MTSRDIPVIPAARRRARVPTPIVAAAARTIERARDLLPRGRPLPPETWARRHRAILALLWGHVAAVFLFALWTNHGIPIAVSESSTVAVAALVAGWRRWSHRTRAAAASFGLVSASAMFVHLSGGFVEAHFHFFVMIAVISLYQDWGPFLVAIGYVTLHHAVLGLVDPDAVFNHPAARANPVLWAAIHGGFVLAASVASLVSWRFVEQQSLHDPLTGLANRALFEERLNRGLGLSARTGRSLAVMYLDVDDFKTVNDRLGHAAGDELLRMIASRLKAVMRPVDTAARLGGDEFGVLLEDLTESSGAVAIAERIRAAMTEPFRLTPMSVDVKLSIGIALAEVSDTADTVVRGADLAMYAAKRAGGGRVRLFDPAIDHRVGEVKPDLRALGTA
ncbi:MAG: diguanylate cyclase [Chloroflexota bacterium]|jgi:diguanylate cyclase (GGDEF)-like protein|nr:diguanylate cyclase [Chloroflexota bacterium]